MRRPYPFMGHFGTVTGPMKVTSSLRPCGSGPNTTEEFAIKYTTSGSCPRRSNRADGGMTGPVGAADVDSLDVAGALWSPALAMVTTKAEAQRSTAAKTFFIFFIFFIETFFLH